MTNTKHAQGPWRTEKMDATTVLIIDNDGAIVADVNSGSTFRKLSDKQYANARLIAAAPELLEALKTIADSEEHRGETIVCDFETLQSVARAVIAKATGGAA